MDICKPTIEKGEKVEATLPIKNINRTVGTIVGSELTRRHGLDGLEEDTVKLHFNGSAGQSFGAFVPKSMTLTLEGDSNELYRERSFWRQINSLSPKKLYIYT